METSREKANSDLFFHELECSDFKLFVCKICTDPFIVGKILRPSKNYLLTTLHAMPPLTHGDKLSDKTNNGLDLETMFSSQDFELVFGVGSRARILS